MMKKISNSIEATTTFFARLSAFLVIVLSIMIVYEAINRYFFQNGSVMMQELQWHLFDIIFLLGLSYTLQQDKHVRVDIFYTHFSNKTQAIVNIVGIIFLILPLTIIILKTSYTFVEMSYNQNEISSDPGGLCCRYIIKATILFGFVLLGLQSISELYKNFLTIKGTK